MKKRIVSLFAAAAVAVGAMISTMAYTDEQEYEADALNSLGLFLGTDKGYELDKSLTRAEGVTLIVRMYGKVAEATANADKYDIPFVDLVGWEKGYVGYAYENNITKGISDTQFAPTAELTDYMFLTFTLRALGYNDLGDDAQFTWNDPYELAKTTGLIDNAEADTDFNRGDAASIFWNALEAELVGKDMTLAESLIAEGVFTAEAYEKAIDMSDDGKIEDTTESDDNQGGGLYDNETERDDSTVNTGNTTEESDDTSTNTEDNQGGGLYNNETKQDDSTVNTGNTTEESDDTSTDTGDNQGGGLYDNETERDFG